MNALYRYLDKLDEIKNDIQLHLHQVNSRLINREGRLVFYDVTNYYFEIDIPDEETITENGEIINVGLRRRGPSKEHRPKPIV
ncbi:IS1634 family transposase ISSeq4 [Enterococcus cecorum]|nr:IS1634 family transposase ISSeq4 [Enterococcus cecorum]CAI3254227.1 IS1634 family transposase ISSeq4 [Enterococcus cecorum]CAI3266562.1 IS1634 family transposase ISSeq4 [Enterococcus cecorum]CAI3296876.1 IS1634 family transposase ISSeq4 [Enterococcus cecorum]CAI3301911.1 IS1634 family transposase ISSeq4 [Enterococcus cecorum]